MMPSNCTRCAHCCTLRVRLSFLEYIKLILLGHRRSLEKDIKAWAIKQRKDNTCFFLEGNNCKIYKHRPKMCRDYPGVEMCPRGP